MFIFVVLFVLLCIYKIKFAPEFFEKMGGYNTDYLSIEKTTSVKGIFILLVFFKHIKDYLDINSTIDSYAMLPILLLGQCIVTMFLFYSGYGVMESIKKKGTSYINSIPKIRILGTLYRFDIALMLFLLVGLLLGKTFSFKQILLSLIGWDSLGNSNWYIFVILILYVFSYISFSLFKDNRIKGFIGVLVLSAIYMLAVIIFHIRNFFWCDTVLCYSLGMFYSLYKDRIENFLKHSTIYFSSLILFFIASLALIYCVENGFGKIFDLILMLVFTIFVLLLTMKISLNNKILNWFGTHLFEIYILQRIPMMIFERIGLNNSIYLFFVLCFGTTILLAWIYKIIIDKTWKLIIKR